MIQPTSVCTALGRYPSKRIRCPHPQLIPLTPPRAPRGQSRFQQAAPHLTQPRQGGHLGGGEVTVWGVAQPGGQGHHLVLQVIQHGGERAIVHGDTFLRGCRPQCLSTNRDQEGITSSDNL